MTWAKDVKSTHMGNKGGLSGAMIASIIMGVLLVLAIVLAIMSKKRSSFSSNLVEEPETPGRRKSFSYIGSNPFSTELGADKHKSYIGKFLVLYKLPSFFRD